METVPGPMRAHVSGPFVTEMTSVHEGQGRSHHHPEYGLDNCLLMAAPVGLHKSELRIQEWDWDLSSFAPQQDTTSPGNSSLRGWTINISVEKSSAVKLAMSSKASGRKKLENRLVTGNWKKIDREGVPWESSEKSGSRDWRKGWGCWTILMGRKSRPTL